MKKMKFIIGLIVATVVFLLLQFMDIIEISTLIGRLCIAALFGGGATILLSMIMDQIQVSHKECVGHIFGKDPNSLDPSLYPYQRGYYLFVRTEEGKDIMCQCSQEEWEIAKAGIAVRYIEDTRQSGEVYHYTAIRAFDIAGGDMCSRFPWSFFYVSYHDVLTFYYKYI